MIARPTDTRDPNFVTLLNLYVNQVNQDAANAKVHDEWLQAAANWKTKNQHQKELSLAIDAPLVLPTMTIWHDDGTIDHPLFPDLKLPVLDSTASTSAGGLRPPAANIPLDRIDGIVLTLQLVLQSLDALKQAMGVK